jgi:hypothetical protein
MSAALMIYSTSLYTFANERQRIINNDVTRVAVDQFSRYLRGTSYPESTQRIADSVEAAEANRLVFYSDIDGDGRSEKVEYYLTGPANAGTLNLKVYQPIMSTIPPTYGAASDSGTVVLSAVRNTSGPLFTYYWFDSSLTPPSLVAYTSGQVSAPLSAAQMSAVVGVGIRLVVNEVPRIAKGNVELTTTVQIRQRFNGGLQP